MQYADHQANQPAHHPTGHTHGQPEAGRFTHPRSVEQRQADKRQRGERKADSRAQQAAEQTLSQTEEGFHRPYCLA